MTQGRLPQSFFERDTRVVAVELIGKELVFQASGGRIIRGKIVETEAYYGADDPASHAFRGPTPRNRVMFGPAGVTYVYFTYGNHHCLNLVTESDGKPGAVLIRALEPLDGIEVMKRNRKNDHENQLTNGPGKLTQAFGITREHSGLNVVTGPIGVEASGASRIFSIGVSPRIGISAGQEKLLRFYLKGNPFVSKRG